MAVKRQRLAAVLKGRSELKKKKKSKQETSDTIASSTFAMPSEHHTDVQAAHPHTHTEHILVQTTHNALYTAHTGCTLCPFCTSPTHTARSARCRFHCAFVNYSHCPFLCTMSTMCTVHRILWTQQTNACCTVQSAIHTVHAMHST